MNDIEEKNKELAINIVFVGITDMFSKGFLVDVLKDMLSGSQKKELVYRLIEKDRALESAINSPNPGQKVPAEFEYKDDGLGHVVRTRKPSTLPYPPCYLCPKTFTSMDELNKHIEIDHTTKTPTNECTNCGNTYVAYQELMEHINLKH